MMKKILVVGSFLAFSGISNAQWSGGCPEALTTCYAGIGTTSPGDLFHIKSFQSGMNQGMIIENAHNFAASLRFITNSSGSVPGSNFLLGATGPSNGTSGSPGSGTGNMVIYDYNSSQYALFLEKGTDNIGFGTVSPQARLHAVSSSVAMRGDATGTGVAGNGTGSGNIGTMMGVRGQSYGGATNYGGYFTGLGNTSAVTSYGVYAQVFNTAAGGTNYGIYSTVGGVASSNPLGAGPNYAGYFDGDLVVTAGCFFPSDKRIKKDVAKINGSLDIIKKLNPVTYNFDKEANPSVSLPGEKQYGFISQEVKEILPEFTKTIINPAKTDENGKEICPSKEILGLNYNGFIALLTKGIQEQQAIIDELKNANTAQQQQIDELLRRTGTTTGISQTNNDGSFFSMSQNEPNPFSNETVIKYTLTEQTKTATLNVYDLSGKQITSFPLTEKGSSSITITSEKLAAGIYIYSIVADGKIMDSKRMVVAEK